MNMSDPSIQGLLHLYHQNPNAFIELLPGDNKPEEAYILQIGDLQLAYVGDPGVVPPRPVAPVNKQGAVVAEPGWFTSLVQRTKNLLGRGEADIRNKVVELTNRHERLGKEYDLKTKTIDFQILLQEVTDLLKVATKVKIKDLEGQVKALHESVVFELGLAAQEYVKQLFLKCTAIWNNQDQRPVSELQNQTNVVKEELNEVTFNVEQSHLKDFIQKLEVDLAKRAAIELLESKLVELQVNERPFSRLLIEIQTVEKELKGLDERAAVLLERCKQILGIKAEGHLKQISMDLKNLSEQFDTSDDNRAIIVSLAHLSVELNLVSNICNQEAIQQLKTQIANIAAQASVRDQELRKQRKVQEEQDANIAAALSIHEQVIQPLWTELARLEASFRDSQNLTNYPDEAHRKNLAIIFSKDTEKFYKGLPDEPSYMELRTATAEFMRTLSTITNN